MEVVKLLINGIEVEGIVIRTLYDFNIKIVKPYKNLSGGLHIPHFAREHMSFKGEYGDKRIRDLLKELYILGKYLEDEMEHLKEKINYIDDNCADSSLEMIDENTFKTKRITLKERLRSGEIDNKEYQKLLTQLRKKYKLWEQKNRELMDSFFEENFPMVVPVETRKEVINIIKGKKA
jgi:uncharacterized membrane protein